MNTPIPKPPRAARPAPRSGAHRPSLAMVLTVALALASTALAPQTAQAVDCNPIKIWTYNVRYNDGWACISDCDNEWYRTVGRIARRDVAEQYLKAGSPDIFGLQEVRNPAESAGVRVSQLKDVGRWFPNHDYYALDRGDGEHCAIFYRNARFLRMTAGTFWASCTPDVSGSKYPIDDEAGHAPRIVSWVKLLDLNTSQSFYVFNSHWSLKGTTRLYTAALIRERIRSIAGDQPAILMGDFNCPEGDEAFKVLTAETPYSGSSECLIQPKAVPANVLSLVNSYRQVIPSPTGQEGTFHNFQGSTSGSRIDHVLHTEGDFLPYAAAIQHDTYPGFCGDTGCYPSDHFAVEMRFRPLQANTFVDARRSEVTCETGTAVSPYNTLGEALNNVKVGGKISLISGSLPGNITLNPTRGPVIVTSIGGASVIGK